MRSSMKVGVLGALCALVIAAPASAQFVWVGGGGTFPMSDYGDYAKTGFLLSGGAGIPLGDRGLGAFAEGFYGQNNHSDVAGEKTTPYGVMAGLQYNVAGADADRSLYVLGGLGFMVHKYVSDLYPSSSNGLGFTGGVGYFFPLGAISGYVEGRFFHAKIEDANTTFPGLMAGISVPLRQRSGS